MSKKTLEIFSVVASIAAVITVPIAVVAVWLAWKGSWDIAQLSGAFDKPIVTLGLDNLRLDPRNPIDLLFGTRGLDKKGTATIGSLPFTLVNEGNKSTELASIIFRYPLFFDYKFISERISNEQKGPSSILDLKHTTSNDEKFDYSTYNLASLGPSVALTVEEPIHLNDTRVREDVPITTKDNISGTATVELVYSKNYLITTLAKDQQPVNYDINLASTRAVNLEELRQFANKYMIEPRIRNYERKCYVYGLSRYSHLPKQIYKYIFSPTKYERK